MKMLLIDDDAVSRAALIGIIGPPNGWEIIETSDGRQALDLLHKGLKPEFCVVDLLMPVMNGMDFLMEVRTHPQLQNLKVVVVSAKSDRSTIMSLARLHVSGYLLKPFDAAKVKASLLALAPANTVVPLQKKAIAHTLLAVDDDPVIHAAITSLLSFSVGWDVKFAVDGDDAFEHLYAGLRPDLILTDLKMANVDGVTLIKRIRKDRNFSEVKVAVMTGVNDPNSTAELDALNVCEFMRKPVDSLQFTNLLKRVAG